MNYISILMNLIFVFIGIVFYKGKLVNLVAGFDEKVDNREKVGKWVGSNFIIIGFSLIFQTILDYALDLGNNNYITIIKIFIISVIVLRTVIFANKKLESNNYNIYFNYYNIYKMSTKSFENTNLRII